MGACRADSGTIMLMMLLQLMMMKMMITTTTATTIIIMMMMIKMMMIMMMMMMMIMMMMMMIKMMMIMMMIIIIIIALKYENRDSLQSPLRRKLSPTRTLKRPHRNRVQITCKTLLAHHVQPNCSFYTVVCFSFKTSTLSSSDFTK